MQINGSHLVSAFKADVEGFFEKAGGFEIRIVNGGWNPPKCIGRGGGAKISLPDSIYEKVIESYEDMALVLFVLGHEAAHYLHRHNEHKDPSPVEDHGLEMWADFFGTKLALVSMTYGPSITKLRERLPRSKTTSDRIDAIASVLATLATSYFETKSARYPSANVRVATCVAGMLSFFEKFFQFKAVEMWDMSELAKSLNPQNIVERAFGIQMRIYNNCRLMAIRSKTPPDLNSEQIQLIFAMHRKIQGAQHLLFRGMKALPSIWLRLDYSIPENERKSRALDKRRLLKKTLDGMGFDSSALDGR